VVLKTLVVAGGCPRLQAVAELSRKLILLLRVAVGCWWLPAISSGDFLCASADATPMLLGGRTSTEIMAPTESSGREKKKTELVHLRSLPSNEADTATGQVQLMWPEIEAAFAKGRTGKSGKQPGAMALASPTPRPALRYKKMIGGQFLPDETFGTRRKRWPDSWL
jgi:hypothetical protein